MPQILEYERDQTATLGAQRARIAFSVACVPSVGLAVVVAAMLWHLTGGGGEFSGTVSVMVRYCGLATIVGLLVIWLAALLPFRLVRVRGVAASAAAGVAYGVVPSVAFAIAETMERLGDWVWLAALFVAGVCVPACVVVWLTPRR